MQNTNFYYTISIPHTLSLLLHRSLNTILKATTTNQPLPRQIQKNNLNSHPGAASSEQPRRPVFVDQNDDDIRVVRLTAAAAVNTHAGAAPSDLTRGSYASSRAYGPQITQRAAAAQNTYYHDDAAAGHRQTYGAFGQSDTTQAVDVVVDSRLR